MLSRKLKKLRFIFVLMGGGVTALLAQEIPAGGFSVDRSSRNAVAGFFQKYYRASEGFEERYGATVTFNQTSVPTPSPIFNRDVERRVNFFRALAGLPSDIDFSNREVFRLSDDAFSPPSGTLRQRACMEMAFVISKTKLVTHDLPQNTPFFTTSAWNAGRFSNLVSGFYGPTAIDNYIGEPGDLTDPEFGVDIGHRRWVFFSRLSQMNTGDMPVTISSDGQQVNPASNVLYTIGDFKPPQPSQFTCWPLDGHHPFNRLPTFWSLSYAGAIFNNATVTLTGPGGVVPLSIVSTHVDATVENPPAGESRTFGDSTIVFEPEREGLIIHSDRNTVYSVQMSGIEGGGPTSYSYDTILFNPNQLDQDVVLTGVTTPPASGANYAFPEIAEAENYQFQISEEIPADWVEGGEDDTSSFVIINPPLSPSSLVRSSLRAASGSKSLRLSFPPFTGNTQFDFQGFVLARSVVPQSGATVNFMGYRDVFFEDNEVHLEVSEDAGQTWESILSIEGPATRPRGAIEMPETEFRPYQASLEAFVGKTVNLRFVIRKSDFSKESGQFFRYDFATGISNVFTGFFIDDIRLANSLTLDSDRIVTLPADARFASFNEAALGESLVEGRTYKIRGRAIIEDHPFPWGPFLNVTPSSNPQPNSGWDFYRTIIAPGVVDFEADDDGDGLPNGIEYTLGKNALDRFDGSIVMNSEIENDRLCLRTPLSEGLPEGVTLGAEISQDAKDWSSEGTEVVVEDGMIKAFVPRQGRSVLFLRWTTKLN